jgi:hypothetical protein
MSGRGAIARIARRIASSEARWILIASISAGATDTTDQAIARRVICAYRRSRSSAGTVLESARPGMW